MSQSEEFPFGDGSTDAVRPAASPGPVMSMSFDDEEPTAPATPPAPTARGQVFGMEFDDEPAATAPVVVASTPVVTTAPTPAAPAVKSAPAMAKTPRVPGAWKSRLREMADVPAWGVSLAAHLVLIGFLLCVNFAVVSKTKSEIIESTTEEVAQDQLNFDNAVMAHDQVGADSEVTNFSLAVGTLSMGTENGTAGVVRQVTDDIASASGNGSGPVVEVMPEPEGNSLQTPIVVGGQHGPSTESPGSTKGAIDRLTYEIAGTLEKNKALVVWMFDASLSLREKRAEIASRFENVYKQLDSLEVGQDKALKTAVMYWGKNHAFITDEPVDDVRPLVEKVKKIPNDETGIENVFTAVEAVTQKFRDYKKNGRRVMAIIVTDERGDDYAKMEQAIANARKYGMKFYVVGHAAPFGREHGHIYWKDDKFEGDVEIDQGPETLYPEALRLGFWGARGPSLERLSSGYGPWALTRLCRETGGLYLVSQEQSRAIQFDFNTMRNYQPDYRPVADIDRDLKKNRAKTSLIEAATKTKAEELPIPRTVFRADNDNALRTEITEAQRPLAILEYKLNEMVTLLGQGEKDREKITEPRWKAAYDLAYGRALAMRTRSFGYNMMLAEMKSTIKPFQTKGSNQWELVPSKNINAGAQAKKMEKQASTLLKRVMDEHGGTPWALLAERELSTPMGWDWKEGTADYAAMDRRMADAKRGPVFANEDEKKKAAKKKQMEQQAKKPTL